MAENFINVDVSGGFNAEALGPLADALRAKWVATLGEQAYSEWRQLAQNNLRTMRGSYIAGLMRPEVDENQAVVVLAGTTANRVEQGYAAYDMHDTLLGDKVPTVPRGQRGKHLSKKGKMYRYVPFRHATPGTMGEVGPAMGSAYGEMLGDAAAISLGKRVHEMAKVLVASVEKPGGGTSFGGSLPSGLAPKLKPHHSTDIYAGMYREEKMYDEVKQNTYTTFRTISTGSPGWRVAAQEGKHFAEQVAAFIKDNADATFQQVCAEMDQT